MSELWRKEREIFEGRIEALEVAHDELEQENEKLALQVFRQNRLLEAAEKEVLSLRTEITRLNADRTYSVG